MLVSPPSLPLPILRASEHHSGFGAYQFFEFSTVSKPSSRTTSRIDLHNVGIYSTIVDVMPTISVLKALFPDARRRILCELVRSEGELVHLRELARRIGMDVKGVQRECRNLESVGLLTCKKYGNQVVYSLDANAPVYNEIKMLIVKTEGIADIIRKALLDSGLKFDLAYIFGSYATGDFQTHSDIDLLIVSESPSLEFSHVLSITESILQREVNAIIYTPAEYDTEIRDENSFIHGIASSDRIVL